MRRDLNIVSISTRFSIDWERLWRAFRCCTLTAVFLFAAYACTPLSREPGLSRQATATAANPTPSPTPPPVIEVLGLTVQQEADTADWAVYGLIENITDDGLAELELRVSVLTADDGVPTQKAFFPALRRLPPGDQTAFSVDLDEIEGPILVDQVLVELSSFEKTSVEQVQIDVEQLEPRTNYETGSTYLGYLSNLERKSVQIRNIEAFILNTDGLPIDSAEQLVTISSIDVGSQVPFRVDFCGDTSGSTPYFYIDAVEAQGIDPPSRLWSISDPELFFTNQGIPYYLVELNNRAFAPQSVEGLFTLHKGGELIGVLPLKSFAPIPAKSSGYLTVAPGLELPHALRSDEDAIRELVVEVILDPLASRGVDDNIVAIDLEIQSVEAIGGSIHLKGIASNSSDQELRAPVVNAVLRDDNGKVVSAISAQIKDTLPAGGQEDFTLSLWIPANTSPNALEFDLNAAGRSGHENDAQIE